MTTTTHLASQPHAAVMRGQLYAYGRTYDACRANLRSQLAGAPPAMHARMMDRMTYITLDDDLASEVEAMLDAPVIEWLPT